MRLTEPIIPAVPQPWLRELPATMKLTDVGRGDLRQELPSTMRLTHPIIPELVQPRLCELPSTMRLTDSAQDDP